MSSDLAGTDAAEWKNATLGRFLEALSACLEAEEVGASWAAFVRALVKATGYE